jgi:hypothetical protein
MLAGDYQRRQQSPITLGGHHVGRAITSMVMVPVPPPAPSERLERPVSYRGGRSTPEKDTERDGDGPYSHEQLLEMDRRFVEALERAIAAGDEHPAK